MVAMATAQVQSELAAEKAKVVAAEAAAGRAQTELAAAKAAASEAKRLADVAKGQQEELKVRHTPHAARARPCLSRPCPLARALSPPLSVTRAPRRPATGGCRRS